MVSTMEFAESRSSQYGQVVRFGSAAGEDHLTGFAPPDSCQSVAKFIEGRPRPASDRVDAGGVAPELIAERFHRLPDARVRRRGGVVVPVDGIHSGWVGFRCKQACDSEGADLDVAEPDVVTVVLQADVAGSILREAGHALELGF